MALEHSPRIVTDGLVLALDAADRNSYVSGSSTWYDLAGSNNGTLVNGPTFNSANGGSIVFDGVNDRVNLTNPNSSQYTFGIAMKRNTTPIYDFESFLFVNGQTNQASDRIGISINLRFNWRYRKTDGTYTTLQTGTNYVQLNEIAILHGMYDGNDVKFYKNGILTNTFPSISFYDGWGGLTSLGFNQSNTSYFNGNIYNFQVYNRALTAAEILQNYNATKTRFGL